MKKCLTSKLHLKYHLYSHRMIKGISLKNHLTAFKEIVTDLKNLEINYDEDDLCLILFYLLPSLYMLFRDMILTIEEVYNTLFSKEKMKHLVQSKTQGEDLVVCS